MFLLLALKLFHTSLSNVSIDDFDQINVSWIKKDLVSFSLPNATHCMKCVRIRSYSGPYFPRITPNTDTFYAVTCI